MRAHVLVEGRVQGVWFRGSTRRRALELGLTGFARNLPDGRVECVFEGEEDDVARALLFVRSGPPGARVTSVQESHGPAQGDLDGFRVL